MITIHCHHCGQPIQTSACLANRKKFCSRSCLGRSKTGVRAPNFKDGRTLLQRVCRQCGASFVGAARNHYCSLKCFAASRPPTFKSCPWCKCLFGPVEHLSRKFCSKACVYRAHTTGRRTFRKTYTKARNAQSLLRYHVQAGHIVRPTVCEECGATDRRIEGAHFNYDEPLRVRWLCKSCHVRWDKREPKNATFIVSTKARTDQKWRPIPRSFVDSVLPDLRSHDTERSDPS